MNKTPTFRDAERISAYLDGQLSTADARRLSDRLNSDPALASVYDELSQARALLRQTPQRRAPRNFTLTPKMAGIKPPVPRLVPVMRFASVLTAILLFMTFAVNSFSTIQPGGWDPYGYGYGIGGGAPEEAADEPALLMQEAVTEALVATEAPAAAPAPELRLLTPSPEPAATLMALAPAQPPETADQVIVTPQAKTGPDETGFLPPPIPSVRNKPVASGWQIGLAVLAVLLGGSVFVLVRLNDARWRRKK